MFRALTVATATVVVAIFSLSCTNVVPLAAGYYPAKLESEEVLVIDARNFERPQIERILDEHQVIGRFDVSIPQGEGFEQSLAGEVEKAKLRVLKSGGNVLMYTDNSELIAVIRRDARFAGAPDAITMYVMLSQE